MARAMRIPTDGWLIPPESLVDREWIVGVTERIDKHGEILHPLDGVQLRVGHHHGDLENAVAVGNEARHLHVYPHQRGLVLCHWGLILPDIRVAPIVSRRPAVHHTT